MVELSESLSPKSVCYDNSKLSGTINEALSFAKIFPEITTVALPSSSVLVITSKSS